MDFFGIYLGFTRISRIPEFPGARASYRSAGDFIKCPAAVTGLAPLPARQAC
jgi:hypothetical protein